nr:nickel ABC transporter permease [Methanococcoides sp.]
MRGYVLRRLLYLVPSLLFISILSFSLIYIAPGDPAEILMTSPLGGADEKAVEEFRVKMGLDQPLHIQYYLWLEKAVHGDFGYSYMTNRLVLETIIDAFKNTLKLSALSLAIALIIAIPVGILAALKYNTISDDLSRFVSLIGVSIPNFWQAYLLILFFSVFLQWLPAAGIGEGGDIRHMILPALTMGTSSAAVIMRMMRSSMLEVMEMDYIRTARSKGLSELTVIMKHAMKNALIPVVTMIGLSIGFMLNGSMIVETIFGWPGIGRLVVESIYSRDYPMIQGSILFVAMVFVVANFLVDILYTWLNPRITYERNK